MTKKRLGLNIIIFYILMMFLVLCFETLNFIVLPNSKTIDIYALICFTTLVSIFIVWFLLICQKPKLDKKTILLFLLYIVILFVGIFGIYNIDPIYELDQGSFFYEVSITNQVAWTLQWILGISVIFLFIFSFIKNLLSIKSIKFILWIIVLVGLIAILYSLIFEYEYYIKAFTGQGNLTDLVKSFFQHQNNYGQALMISIAALILLNAIQFKWWHYILMAILYIGMIFTTCYVSLAFTCFMFVVYTFYIFFKTYKKHPKLNLKTLIITFSCLILIFIICLILYYLDNPIICSIKTFLEANLDNKNFGSLNGRVGLWLRALSTLQTPLDYMFGHGFSNFNNLMSSYNQSINGRGTTFVDSAFIQIICSYGIVGLIIYLSVIFFIFYFAIRLYLKRKNRYVMTSLLILFTFVIYSIFESYILFIPNLLGAASLFLILAPILIENNIIKINKENIIIETKKYVFDKSKIFSYTFFINFIFTLFFAFVLLISNAYQDIFINLFIFSLVSNLTTPYILFKTYSSHNYKKILSILLIPILIFIINLNISISIAFNSVIYSLIIILIIPTLLFLIQDDNFKIYLNLIYKNGIYNFAIPLVANLIIFIPFSIAIRYFNVFSFVTSLLVSLIYLVIFILFTYYYASSMNRGNVFNYFLEFDLLITNDELKRYQNDLKIKNI